MHHTNCTQVKFQHASCFLRTEVAPGDTWSGKCGLLIRFSPLERALLADIHVDAFIFYVPHRMVWSGWEDFLASGPNPSPAPTLPPTIDIGLLGYNALYYPGGSNNTAINSLPIRAYNLIWNEYFRDEEDTAIASTFLPADAGDDVGSKSYGLVINCKRDIMTTIRQELETGTTATADVTAGTPDRS